MRVSCGQELEAWQGEAQDLSTVTLWRAHTLPLQLSSKQKN